MTFKTTKLRDAITFALVAGVTGLAGTGVAFAQDQDQDQDQNQNTEQQQQAKTLDRIEVTGSRLKRAEIEGSLPVTVLDRATIDASGEVSVADYLRTTNFNSTGQFRPQSGSSAQAGAFADLRGLGGQRTLVLIDGHRAPKAPFNAGGGTDLNAIPLAAVERIEVLTDGASAVYGADAVGGVINIITRKDYNGAQISVGKTNPKWGPQDSGDILFGISGDRGHMIGGFSYQRRAMIYNHDLPYNDRGASTYGNNYISFDPVTGDPTSGVPGSRIVPIPGGCTNKNFYISPNNGRCVYDFNAVAADEAAVPAGAVVGRVPGRVADIDRIAGHDRATGPPHEPLEQQPVLAQQVPIGAALEPRADAQPLVDAAGHEVGAVVARGAQAEHELAHRPALVKAHRGLANGLIERLPARVARIEPPPRLGLGQTRRSCGRLKQEPGHGRRHDPKQQSPHASSHDPCTLAAHHPRRRPGRGGLT